MKTLFIVILLSALAWSQGVKLSGKISSVSGKLNINSLALNPGWQFVQEFTPPPGGCSGTSCVTPSSCTSVNCLVPLTVGDVLTIVEEGTSNVTISSITGSSGTSWVNAGCHLNNGGFNQDLEYTTSVGTSVQQLTVNMSGSVGAGDFLVVTEWKPPAGYTGVFDGCVTKIDTACVSCAGASPTVTGTDIVEQFPVGLADAPNGATAYSSPYIATLQGNGICTNCKSGPAPTITMHSSSAVNLVASAFKTSAGIFTPPASVFSIVNFSQPNISGSTNCSTTCSPAITSTGASHLLFLVEFDSQSAANVSISSVTGGGTWVTPAGCHKIASGGWEINCAYALSSSSGTTSLSVTMSGNATSAYFGVWEFSRNDAGSFTLDGSIACTQNAGAANFMPSGQPLTLANNHPHLSLQFIAGPGGLDGASFYPSPYALGVPNGTVISNSNTTGSLAFLVNDTVGQTPVWPFPGASTGTQTAVCGASFL